MLFYFAFRQFSGSPVENCTRYILLPDSLFKELFNALIPTRRTSRGSQSYCAHTPPLHIFQSR
jgi:hypothetical protein